jgi:hypothetical protein
MRNITVAINDKVYRDIRVWCARRDTSVSAVVQRFLEDLPRLKQARPFPLPEAPPPGFLAPLLENLETPQPPVAPAQLPVPGKSSEPVRGHTLTAAVINRNREAASK